MRSYCHSWALPMQILLRLALTTAIAGLLLAVCHDTDTADAAHFQAALQRYYDAHRECIALPVSLPLDVLAGAGDTIHRSLDVLARVGLVETTPVAEAGASAAGTRYALTPPGEKVIRGAADSFIGGSDLCFAQRRILKVTSFTDPALVLGVTSSLVTYDYDLIDVETWARDPAVQAAFPRIKTALSAPSSTATDSVVLTHDDWQHERAVP
jgi:hypothetical protein